VTIDPASIRALTFDVFGTVVDWRSSLIREGEALGRAKGLRVSWSAFADAWRGFYQPMLERVRSGTLPWTKLDDLHRMALDQPWHDAVPGLVRLRRKFILATLSNGNVALLVNMAKRAGLPWDAILGAEVARHYKPQPAAYRTTAELLGLAPAQCLMVAAHNGDLAAAGALGFRTAFVHRRTEHGPTQTTDLRPSRDWDVVADDFIDLAEQLGC